MVQMHVKTEGGVSVIWETNLRDMSPKHASDGLIQLLPVLGYKGHTTVFVKGGCIRLVHLDDGRHLVEHFSKLTSIRLINLLRSIQVKAQRPSISCCMLTHFVRKLRSIA